MLYFTEETKQIIYTNALIIIILIKVLPGPANKYNVHELHCFFFNRHRM